MKTSPRNCRSEVPSDSLAIDVEAIVGAKLPASGMAEVKRRGYGEDGIYFDHGGDDLGVAVCPRAR